MRNHFDPDLICSCCLARNRPCNCWVLGYFQTTVLITLGVVVIFLSVVAFVRI